MAETPSLSEVMPNVPHIALLIDTSREYGRGLLRGVARYHLERGPWSIYFEPFGLSDRPPNWLRNWRGDGILARIDNWRTAEVILSTGLPAVDVRGALRDMPIPFVGLDDRVIARMGFEHLQECGLKNFAYIGYPLGDNHNLDLRNEEFARLVAATGKECNTFLGKPRSRRTATWELEQQQITNWIAKLPKPVGIMACIDDRGNQVLDAARRAGLRVPDEVAVVGTGNDSNVCNLCTPPLSSIDLNSGRVGYEAARLLSQMMEGLRAPSNQVLIGPPRGIATRQSTDILAINDQDVATAMRYIRDHASEEIKISDVIATAQHSPSTLPQRMKAVLGHSLKSEITRVRLNRAKLLLQETSLPVGTIAARSGFIEAKYFSEVFRKSEGTTPSEYRKQFKHQE